MSKTDMTNDEIIITVDSDKGKLECSVINTFEVNQKNYISLLPRESDEILLFRYNELESDAIELINIDDDNEFNQVLDVFDSFMEDIESDK